MAREIKKIAVIGSGVMGAGIAAQAVNVGCSALLFDVVPTNASSRNELAQNAIKKLLASEPPAFTHENKAAMIIPCNLEDDLEKLHDVDWVIEAITEKLDIKQSLYQKIIPYCKQDIIISSNTSTIPLKKLTENLPESYKRNFLITHFFNPPRYTRLLEIVELNEKQQQLIQDISEFARVRFGKEVVLCNDTPGFIANRIGCFWLEIGVKEALKMNIPIEKADAVLGKPFGIPKTAIFGLMDLIGLDVMSLIASSFLKTLDEHDPFYLMYELDPLIKKLIENGYTGRKGKGGFYKMLTTPNGKQKQVLSLKTGEYRDEAKLEMKFPQTLSMLLGQDNPASIYAWRVMSQTLSYAASLIPEICDNIYDVDRAMKYGFNWSYGPFELIDQLASGEVRGAKWFSNKLAKENREVPEILHKIGNQNFYRTKNNQRFFFSPQAEEQYQQVGTRQDEWNLAIIKASPSRIIYENSGARILDLGDDVACIEFKSKMNVLSSTVFDAFERAFPIITSNFKGLVIATDSAHYSAGADLSYFKEKILSQNWQEIEAFIEQGQRIMMILKYAPFPVVSAMTGVALGGGAELILHSSHIQSYIESQMGLVEVGVGLIPGWGGSKEIYLRSVKTNNVELLKSGFVNLLRTATSKSAETAKEMFALDNIFFTTNRSMLLNDAKNLAISAAEKFVPRASDILSVFSANIRSELESSYLGLKDKLSAYEQVIGLKLIELFVAMSKDSKLTEQSLLNLEKECFLELSQNKQTLERLDYMLQHGKQLKN